MPPPQQRISAGFDCLCGAVRGRIARPSRWVAHCHCSVCRRAHGAAALIEGGPDRRPQLHAFWDSHVSWTEADPDLPKRTEPEIVARLKPA
jgi:hypothetical protein